MQRLSSRFEEATGIGIEWVVLEENVLRQRVYRQARMEELFRIRHAQYENGRVAVMVGRQGGQGLDLTPRSIDGIILTTNHHEPQRKPQPSK